MWMLITNFVSRITWSKVFGFIFKVLPIILVVGLFLWVLLAVIPENAKLKQDVALLESQYSELEQNFAIYRANVDLLNESIGAVSDVRVVQGEVRERIRDVPVETTNQPFADPGMRTRADILRDYQRTSPVFDGSGS